MALDAMLAIQPSLYLVIGSPYRTRTAFYFGHINGRRGPFRPFRSVWGAEQLFHEFPYGSRQLVNLLWLLRL
jgi:hypothetical protein